MFYYTCEIVKSGEFQKNAEKRQAVKKWLSRYNGTNNVKVD